MERIVAGRFQTRDDADAVAALIAQYVETSDICIFQSDASGPRDASSTSGAPERRQPGVMLSVHITGPVDERRVIGTLHLQGAADIEQAHGKWRDGDWVDFNPVAAPRLVASASN